MILIVTVCMKYYFVWDNFSGVRISFSDNVIADRLPFFVVRSEPRLALREIVEKVSSCATPTAAFDVSVTWPDWN